MSLAFLAALARMALAALVDAIPKTSGTSAMAGTSTMTGTSVTAATCVMTGTSIMTGTYKMTGTSAMAATSAPCIIQSSSTRWNVGRPSVWKCRKFSNNVVFFPKVFNKKLYTCCRKNPLHNVGPFAILQGIDIAMVFFECSLGFAKHLCSSFSSATCATFAASKASCAF